MDLDAALLPACPRMPPDPLEEQVGEQRDGRRVDYLQPLHPLRHLEAPAVRGKNRTVGRVQVAVDALEDALRTPLVGIGQRAAPYLERDAQMRHLAHLGLQRRRYLAQRVEPHDHGVEHHHQVDPAVEPFRVAFPAVFAADTENFRLVNQFCYLTKERLSAKMCTFAHVIFGFVSAAKITQRADFTTEISPYFLP